MAQSSRFEELKRKYGLDKGGTPTAPGPTTTPTAAAPASESFIDKWVSPAMEKALLAGTFANFIPHPIGQRIGKLSSAAFTALMAARATENVVQKDYLGAAGNAAYAGLGLYGPLRSLIRGGKIGKGGKIVDEVAETVADTKAPKPTYKKGGRSLEAEADILRVARGERRTKDVLAANRLELQMGRELRALIRRNNLNGVQTPGELQRAATAFALRMGKASEALGKRYKLSPKDLKGMADASAKAAKTAKGTNAPAAAGAAVHTIADDVAAVMGKGNKGFREPVSGKPSKSPLPKGHQGPPPSPGVREAGAGTAAAEAVEQKMALDAIRRGAKGGNVGGRLPDTPRKPPSQAALDRAQAAVDAAKVRAGTLAAAPKRPVGRPRKVKETAAHILDREAEVAAGAASRAGTKTAQAALAARQRQRLLKAVNEGVVGTTAAESKAVNTLLKAKRNQGKRIEEFLEQVVRRGKQKNTPLPTVPRVAPEKVAKTRVATNLGAAITRTTAAAGPKGQAYVKDVLNRLGESVKAPKAPPKTPKKPKGKTKKQRQAERIAEAAATGAPGAVRLAEARGVAQAPGKVHQFGKVTEVFIDPATGATVRRLAPGAAQGAVKPPTKVPRNMQSEVPKPDVSTTKKPRLRKKKTAEQKIDEELGAVTSELLLRIGTPVLGGIGGGVAGLRMRPEDAERPPWQYAAAGVGAGALAGILGGSAVSNIGRIGRGGGEKLGEQLIGWNYFSLLSDPTALGRAGAGALASPFVLAAERILTNRPKDALAILKQLAMDTGPSGTWLKVLFSKDPTKFLPKEASAELFRQGQRVPNVPGILGVPGRIISAMDVVSTRAIMAGGYSRAAAMRANLGGDPTSKSAQAFLQFLGHKVRVPKVNRKTGEAVRNKITGELQYTTPKSRAFVDSSAGKLLTRIPFPFARVAAAVPEQAIRYMPGVNMLPGVRRAMSGVPGELVSKELSMARGLIGGGAMAGAAQHASEVSPEFDPSFVAFGGPLAGLVGIGMGVRRMMDTDSSIPTLINRQAAEIPLVSENIPWNLGLERLVPGIVRRTAVGMDPAFGREKGASAIGHSINVLRGDVGQGETLARTLGASLMERIPVLRETLPERDMPRDTFGRSLYPDRNKFLPDVTFRGWTSIPDIVAPKAWTSTPLVNPSRFPKDDPLAQQIRQLGRDSAFAGPIGTPPSVSRSPAKLEALRNLQGRKGETIPRMLRRDLARLRGAASEQTLEALFNSPGFQQLGTAAQRYIYDRVVSASREQVSKSINTLGMAGAINPQSQGQYRSIAQQLIAAKARR